MKLFRRIFGGAWAIVLLAFVITGCSPSSESSALSLIKEANRHVGEQVKDQVVQIRSEKSIGSLTPNVWYVVFYDPDAVPAYS
jgi:hypothetical protein